MVIHQKEGKDEPMNDVLKFGGKGASPSRFEPAEGSKGKRSA